MTTTINEPRNIIEISIYIIRGCAHLTTQQGCPIFPSPTLPQTIVHHAVKILVYKHRPEVKSWISNKLLFLAVQPGTGLNRCKGTRLKPCRRLVASIHSLAASMQWKACKFLSFLWPSSHHLCSTCSLDTINFQAQGTKRWWINPWGLKANKVASKSLQSLQSQKITKILQNGHPFWVCQYLN